MQNTSQSLRELGNIIDPTPMKSINLICSLIFFQISVCNAQLTFRIDESISYPDLSVKISESVSYPDITVKIGENVSYEDFTVGITSNKNQADFIITESRYPDLTVKASESVTYPDLSIKMGETVSYPDVTIKIRKSGTVDYIIFTEKAYISLREIVIALLPAINKELDYKYKKIPIYTEQTNSPTQSSNNSKSNYSDAVNVLNGAKIFAQDDKNTYLGKIASEYDSESIFNEYGTYGSEYNSSCIWNEYSTFGNEYNSLSPFNDYSSKPPMIVKNGKIIGYLTTNESINGGISPYILKGLKDKF